MSHIRGAYDAWHAGLDVDDGGAAPWYDLVRAHLPSLAGLSVLEVACGRGGFATWLGSQGAARVVGADFSRTAALKASRHARALHADNVRIAVADITALGVAGGVFDLVVCCETVEHVPDARAALREVTRVLRPGGTLLLTTPNYLGPMGLYRIYREATGRPYTEVGQPVNAWTLLPRTLRWVRAAGLRVTAIDGVGHYLPVPRRPPVAVSFLDRGSHPLKWLALHSLIVARRP